MLKWLAGCQLQVHVHLISLAYLLNSGTILSKLWSTLNNNSFIQSGSLGSWRFYPFITNCMALFHITRRIHPHALVPIHSESKTYVETPLLPIMFTWRLHVGCVKSLRSLALRLLWWSVIACPKLHVYVGGLRYSFRIYLFHDRLVYRRQIFRHQTGVAWPEDAHQQSGVGRATSHVSLHPVRDVDMRLPLRLSDE